MRHPPLVLVGTLRPSALLGLLALSLSPVRERRTKAGEDEEADEQLDEDDEMLVNEQENYHETHLD